ncbi:MAG: alpha/beta fold hydrolase [Candidatus Zixiibacteriota bacterium]
MFKPFGRLEVWVIVLVSLVLAVVPASVQSEDACIRILKQDSTLNNLVDPPGYKTTPLGTLGGVTHRGTGTQDMILIAGLGFGAGVFEEFMNELEGQYDMYAVTLAGFGGSAAPPCPSEQTSFAEQTWTNGALKGIEKLIKDENIQNPIIVGHWLTGTTLALRLAINHPNKVKAVILLAGAPRWYSTDTLYEMYYGTLDKRVNTVDKYFAPKWFKTVTRETWDDNNFLPQDYAVNPVRGLRLWREAASPKLHVWVRYLCEFNAQDVTAEFDNLTAPTMLLKPGLENLWTEGRNYMDETYGNQTWDESLAKYPKIVAKTIPNSRVCLWFDHPEKVKQEISSFLQSVE